MGKTMSCYPSRCCKFMLESHARMPVDYKRMLMLFVVNSVKLHLTALNAIKQVECETTQHQKNITLPSPRFIILGKYLFEGKSPK